MAIDPTTLNSALELLTLFTAQKVDEKQTELLETLAKKQNGNTPPSDTNEPEPQYGIPPRIKGERVALFYQPTAYDGISDKAIDCRGFNAVLLLVLPNGSSPSCTLTLEGSDAEGGLYFTLPGQNTRIPNLTTAGFYVMQAESAWAKVRIADISGTFTAGQGYQIIAMPYLSTGQEFQSRAIQASLDADEETVALNTKGCGSAAVQITGTFSATLQFEGTVDDTNWVSISAVVPSTGAIVTSATAAGLWVVGCGGYSQARVRISTYTSGTAVVNLRAGPGNQSAILQGPLPAGANAIGKLAANSGVDIGDVDVTSIATGANIIGRVGIDQTTPGTTNLVSIGTNGTVGISSVTAAKLQKTDTAELITCTVASTDYAGAAAAPAGTLYVSFYSSSDYIVAVGVATSTTVGAGHGGGTAVLYPMTVTGTAADDTVHVQSPTAGAVVRVAYLKN